MRPLPANRLNPEKLVLLRYKADRSPKKDGDVPPFGAAQPMPQTTSAPKSSSTSPQARTACWAASAPAGFRPARPPVLW